MSEKEPNSVENDKSRPEDYINRVVDAVFTGGESLKSILGDDLETIKEEGADLFLNFINAITPPLLSEQERIERRKKNRKAKKANKKNE